ncbi:LRR repeats and ubiquitin-like domain-containing protein, partial [Tetrabaena socialis]
ARVADLSHNALAALPASLSALTGLHTLRLGHNALTTAGVPWDALACLSGLTALTLDANALGSIPEAGLAGLSSLQALSVCGNRLTSLPEAVGALAALEVLAADGNRLAGLPGSVGGCGGLKNGT